MAIGRVNTGGGTALNFKVVGGTTQPTNPSENTIWVNTDTEISGYVFASAEPTAADGLVWIRTGLASNTDFNALKKDALWVYPLLAMQYVDGAWVSKETKIYQSGAWVNLIYYLFNGGSTGYSITGSAFGASGNNTGSITIGSALSFDCYQGTFNLFYGCYGDSLDFTPWTTLTIVYDVTQAKTTATGEYFVKVGVGSSTTSFGEVASASAVADVGSNKTLSVNVGSINTSAMPQIQVGCANVAVKQWYLS